MENSLRRVCPRVGIHKCLSYNSLDVHSNVVERYMGMALNISQNGLQLESDRRIKTANILLMFFDQNRNYVATKGRVAYSIKCDCGKHKTGICLQGTCEENLQFVKSLIKSYHYQKKVPIYIS